MCFPAMDRHILKVLCIGTHDYSCDDSSGCGPSFLNVFVKHYDGFIMFLPHPFFHEFN